MLDETRWTPKEVFRTMAARYAHAKGDATGASECR